MYLLGYDIGSSSVKACLVNADTGKIVASDFFPKEEKTCWPCLKTGMSNDNQLSIASIVVWPWDQGDTARCTAPVQDNIEEKRGYVGGSQGDAYAGIYGPTGLMPRGRTCNG